MMWYYWIIATVILFMLIAFWQMLTPTMNFLVDTFDNTSFTTVDVNSSWHVTTQRIQNTWNWWVVVGAIAVVLMIFYISTREEYDTGYIERGY
jgi:hypothetical protein